MKRIKSISKKVNIYISVFVLLVSAGAVFLSGLEVCACFLVSDIWRGAAGQGLIVCRTWEFADNQSGQFPKVGNSLPFVLLQSFSAMPGE